MNLIFGILIFGLIASVIMNLYFARQYLLRPKCPNHSRCGECVHAESLWDENGQFIRPHGEWIEVEPHQSDLEEGIDYREECSICHEPNRHYGLDKYYNISFVTYYKTNFCPNCGADMRGGRQC